MPNEGLVQGVRSRLPDDAQVQMFDDALAPLSADNRLRAQHFAVSMRELFGQIFHGHDGDGGRHQFMARRRRRGMRSAGRIGSFRL
jgi:hypothetical protein